MKNALKALYLQCFADTEAFSSAVFEHIYRPEEAFVINEGEGPVSMLLCPRFSIGKLTGGYVYAACTAEAYRGRGYMARLLAAAGEAMKARGDSFSFLIPGEKGLFDYYARFGYNPAFYCENKPYEPCGPPVSGLRRAEKSDFEQIGALYRQKYAAWNYLDRDAEFYHKLNALYGPAGGGVFVGENGYVMADAGKDHVLIKEYAGDGMPDRAAGHFGLPVKLSVPAASGAPKGCVKPFTDEARKILAEKPLCFNLLFD